MFNRLFNGIKNLAMSSTAKPDVVFVLGAPGAGKGTQCENIVKVSFCVPVLVAKRSKVRVGSQSLAGIAGSNPAGAWMSVY